MQDLSRTTLEQAIRDVLAQGTAPAHWRSGLGPDERRFDMPVKVSDTCAQPDIAGRFGKISGMARDEADAVVSYAVLIFDLEQVWSVEPGDLEPA